MLGHMEARNMEDQITVNGRVFSIRRLLGKGKGGYSYLAADEHGEYVVKHCEAPRQCLVRVNYNSI